MTRSPWLTLGRVSNLPTVWTNVLAAQSLSRARVDTTWTLTALFVFSAFYVGGMYLNDAFDREVDAKQRPERPIPSGLVSARSVFGAGFALLVLGVLGAAWLAHRAEFGDLSSTLGSALGLAAAIVFYDAFHKGNPLSPFFMGLCRVLVYVTAALAASGTVSNAVLWGAGALMCHLIGLTYAAKQENLKRIDGAWPLALLSLPVGYGVWLALSAPVSWPFVLLLAGWLVWSSTFLLSTVRRSIPGGVVRLIAGIALLDALLVSSTGALSLALAAVGMTVLTRLLHGWVAGT